MLHYHIINILLHYYHLQYNIESFHHYIIHVPFSPAGPGCCQAVRLHSQSMWLHRQAAACVNAVAFQHSEKERRQTIPAFVVPTGDKLQGPGRNLA